MNKNSLYKARAPIMYVLFISLVYCNAVFAQTPTIKTETLKQVQGKISGTTTDANGILPGVTITVKGTTSSTISDTAGKYSINADLNGTLVFSYIGI